MIERAIGAGRLPVRVHAEGCWASRKRCTPSTLEQARRARSPASRARRRGGSAGRRVSHRPTPASASAARSSAALSAPAISSNSYAAPAWTSTTSARTTSC
ncbi:DUF6233 domain-containing protein [Streptomyces sp. NPDC055796]